MEPRAFLLFFFLSFSSGKGASFFDEECLNYTVYPVQYVITITPYIYKERSSYYVCEEQVTVIANAPNVQMIEMDAKDLEIQRIIVLDGDRDIVNKYRPYEFNDRTGKFNIYLIEPLRQYSVDKTQYNIKIWFKKNLSVDGLGTFLVPYDDGTSIKKYLIATRLSPHKAKYFFLCFDNPRFEAVFKFKVIVVPSQLGVTHMNNSLVIAKEQGRYENKDKYLTIDYIPSPQVALHQVGFHHSQFGHQKVTAKKTNDTIIIWAPGSKLRNYDYMLQFCERIFNMIHEYATIDRPLVNGPINIVAVPSRIDGYEVGSWNLLTNGETKLAYIPHMSSIRQQQKMKFEIVQQLCRIWLGNPGETERTRWKEEWFKEGMATYLAYYLLAQYDHGVSMHQRWPLGIYGMQMKHKAMAEDWHHSTPALATFNRTLAVEIPQRYKELVTMKTASLIWMIENWLGADKFHASLVNYINNRRGQDISLDNFLNTLDLDTVECQHQFFNGSTATRILKSWFDQRGYPVISVNVLRDRTPNAIQLKQRKFSFTPDNRGDSHYLIPISYVVQNNENCFNCYQPRFTIDQTYTFEENLNGGWIVLNANASGYYRVNYDEESWRLIDKTLKEDRHSIQEQNRAQIVNDVFALYAAGELDYFLALQILDYLDLESSPIVWDSVISGFELLKIDHAACHMTKYLFREWQEFMRNKISTVFNQVATNVQQDSRNRIFRSKVVDFACSLHHQACFEYMRNMYGEYVHSRQRMDPDTRATCYYVMSKHNEQYEKHGLNIYEIEDKYSADDKLALETRFHYRIPQGTPMLDKIVMSTSTEYFVFGNSSEMSSETPAPDKLGGNGPLSSETSAFVLIISFIIVFIS